MQLVWPRPDERCVFRWTWEWGAGAEQKDVEVQCWRARHGHSGADCNCDCEDCSASGKAKLGTSVPAPDGWEERLQDFAHHRERAAAAALKATAKHACKVGLPMTCTFLGKRSDEDQRTYVPEPALWKLTQGMWNVRLWYEWTISVQGEVFTAKESALYMNVVKTRGGVPFPVHVFPARRALETLGSAARRSEAQVEEALRPSTTLSMLIIGVPKSKTSAGHREGVRSTL